MSKNRGHGRGYIGLIIAAMLDSGKPYVDRPADNPVKEQRLFHKVFSRMGRRVKITTDKEAGRITFTNRK